MFCMLIVTLAVILGWDLVLRSELACIQLYWYGNMMHVVACVYFKNDVKLYILNLYFLLMLQDPAFFFFFKVSFS